MGVVKIGLYPIIILIAWYISQKQNNAYMPLFLIKRIKTGPLFFLSLIIGLYSMSYNQLFWWGDVVYYDAFFSEGLPFPDSIGLNFIYSVLHIFTNKTDVLLFAVAFLSSYVMLLSYREYEEAYSVSIVLLFLTTFFIETCQVNLKQGIACGFASFFFCSVFKKQYFQAVLFFIAACLFHVTAGVILGISFVAIKAVSIRNKSFRIVVFLIVFLCFAFYDQIFALLQRFGQMIPALGSKLAEYSAESGGLGQDSTGLIAFKGIPYYAISIIGILDRKKLRETVKNYDGFLVLSLLASASYLLSVQSYWMSRIIGYYWMTDLVFFGILLFHMKNKQNRLLIKFSVSIILFVLTFRQLIQMY